MEQAESILVIILSVTLTVFLIVAIVLCITLIKLANHLKMLSIKANAVVNNVEHAASLLGKTAGPLAIGKLLANILDLVGKKKKGR